MSEPLTKARIESWRDAAHRSAAYDVEHLCDTALRYLADRNNSEAALVGARAALDAERQRAEKAEGLANRHYQAMHLASERADAAEREREAEEASRMAADQARDEAQKIAVSEMVLADRAEAEAGQLRAALDYASAIARGIGEHAFGLVSEQFPDEPAFRSPGFTTQMTEYTRTIGEAIASAIDKRAAVAALDRREQPEVGESK